MPQRGHRKVRKKPRVAADAGVTVSVIYGKNAARCAASQCRQYDCSVRTLKCLPTVQFQNVEQLDNDAANSFPSDFVLIQMEYLECIICDSVCVRVCRSPGRTRSRSAMNRDASVRATTPPLTTTAVEISQSPSRQDHTLTAENAERHAEHVRNL